MLGDGRTAVTVHEVTLANLTLREKLSLK